MDVHDDHMDVLTARAKISMDRSRSSIRPPGRSRDALVMTDIEHNKRVVRGFCDLAFNDKRAADAAEQFLGSEYIQHNPTAPDGPEGFVEFAGGFVAQAPELSLEIKRLIAEGDMVVAHSLLKVTPDEAGTVVVDIFRLEEGRIVEHWDVMQPFPETSVNDHPMF